MPRPPRALGRRPRHPVPSHASAAARDHLAALPARAWRRLSWRAGSRGRLSARFAAVRVKVAEGPRQLGAAVRPPVADRWLVGEWRDDGERKYYLTNLPATATLRELVRALKQRWACEQGRTPCVAGQPAWRTSS